MIYIFTKAIQKGYIKINHLLKMKSTISISAIIIVIKQSMIIKNERLEVLQ